MTAGRLAGKGYVRSRNAEASKAEGLEVDPAPRQRHAATGALGAMLEIDRGG